MLHKMRRVAGDAARTTAPGRYYHVVLLILCLTASSTTAIAVSSNGERRLYLRRTLTAVGDGDGDGVGVAETESICRIVWTAGKVETRRQKQDEYSEMTTADAALPATDTSLRERGARLLLELRGGSEGLKSEEWSREKAAAGLARTGRTGGNAGLSKAEAQGVKYFEGSSDGAAMGGAVAPTSPPALIVRDEMEIFRCDEAVTIAGNVGIGMGLNEGGASIVEIGQGGDESRPSSTEDRRSRSEREQDGLVATRRLEPGDSHTERKTESTISGASMVEEKQAERRRLGVGLEAAPASGDPTAATGSGWATHDAVLVRDSATKNAEATTAWSVGAAAEVRTAVRDEPSLAGRDALATESLREATGIADGGVGGGGGGGVDSEGSDGFGARDTFDLPSAGADAKGVKAVRRRRTATTTTAPSGDWERKPAPPEEGSAGTETRTGTARGSRPDGLPRAGAPPPPRGEVRVWRPWGRHGVVDSSLGGGSGSDSGSRVGESGGAAPVVGMATPEIEVASAPGGEGEVCAAGEVAENGKAKARRVRWEPKYLTVKAVFFLFYSSLGAIMPYLPVYYHSLGIPDTRIGHLGAITPAMTFIFTPLWGALTDKSGMLKQILVVTFAASTLLRVSLAARTSFFWIVSVITLTAIINAPVRPLLDSSALQALNDRGEYGKQRLWGQWGFGLGSFVTGKLLSRFGFKAAFYMHAAFSLPTLFILLRFSPKKEDLGREPPKFGELYRLVVHDPDVLVFFSMVFAIGLSSGVIENFAYKRLRELGGTGSVLGVSRLVSSLSGIPMFFFSGAIVKHFSIVGILTASMMSFIARFVIYASIKNPWAGLPAEALRGVTFAGFWAASTCHVGAIAPPGLSTTMLGLLNATYGGIGQSLGSLIGGSLSMHFGTARAFLVYASVDACLLLAFFLFWGLHPNGQQKDRGAGGGIGSSGRGAGDTWKAARHPALPPAVTAMAPPPAVPLQDQTFSPHPQVSQR